MTNEKSFNYAPFITHSNYLHYIREISENLNFSCTLDSSNAVQLDYKFTQKIKLIHLTLENLHQEYSNIQKYHEYSVVCTSWIPVKSYYLIFNLTILLEYLISSKNNCLSFMHNEAIRQFKKLISDNTFKFSRVEFNKIYFPSQIKTWKIPVWQNIRSANVTNETRNRQIIKKLYEYAKEDYKRKRQIDVLSGKSKEKFEKTTSINLYEFFYWYRIKANYRDMEFVDEGVSIENFFNFYSDYYYLTLNFYNSFKDCLNYLTSIKLGKKYFS